VNRKGLVLLISLTLLATACGKRTRPDTDPAGDAVPSAGAADPNAGNAQTTGVETVNATPAANSQGALGPDSELGSQRVIYFEFDSSEIASNYVDVLAAHGRFLSSNATLRVRLEGHTDERGSREYNIGLAERRAQTVRRALGLQGVQATQISTVSYGEERPAASGSDENAYSRNRRVEIVYIN
jgi:peptidoglycan-associated lipoprotein